jgi:hypothetical protein
MSDGVAPKRRRKARLKYDKSVKPTSAATSAILRCRQRIAQQSHGAFQPPLKHVIRKALAGLFQQQMDITRRDAEQPRYGCRTKAGIATAIFDFAQNGSAASGANIETTNERITALAHAVWSEWWQAAFKNAANNRQDNSEMEFTLDTARRSSYGLAFSRMSDGVAPKRRRTARLK